ncbi:VWA domain-containing protein [Haloarcula sp. 1CSR25-25]|uniref:VWA domain-containing protein n=1 Tax=Haloarcula sp. 1CSR25-25 TaxID=2862545 RepID=UPI0028982A07|nr:VWA domain-containing protein [Haloarcula sp. 1CSR25-25]
MSKIKEDTKGGFNSFLKDQRGEVGTATVTLYDFNTNVELVYAESPIADAPRLTSETYTPVGKTALHDALYTAVTETAERIAATDQSEQPDNVIIVTLTDGKENASETNHKRVQEQVQMRREEQGWEFLFIGANQDAALTAENMGMDADRSLNMAHSGEGTQAAYESTSEQISNVRQEGHTSGYSATDRQRQENARHD